MSAVLAAPRVLREWRCIALRADGKRCNALLGRFAPGSVAEIKCWRCGALHLISITQKAA